MVRGTHHWYHSRSAYGCIREANGRCRCAAGTRHAEHIYSADIDERSTSAGIAFVPFVTFVALITLVTLVTLGSGRTLHIPTDGNLRGSTISRRVNSAQLSIDFLIARV